jgi:hypothetical protein
VVEFHRRQQLAKQMGSLSIIPKRGRPMAMEARTSLPVEWLIPLAQHIWPAVRSGPRVGKRGGGLTWHLLGGQLRGVLQADKEEEACSSEEQNG